MAQLRQEHDQYTKRSAVVVVAGPEKPGAFAEYWTKENLPFIGLPDPEHRVLKLFGQQVKIFKLGRMPAQVLVDKAGVVRYVHYGHSMSDIPENREMLDLLDRLETGEQTKRSAP